MGESEMIDDILEETGFFENSEKMQIFTREWKLVGDWKPRALVFIAHGAKEHCHWYRRIASCLVKSGCYVFAHDHVGHGKSEGDRVHIEEFATYTRDVLQHCDEQKKKFPDLPLFIVGHSMGGAIAVKSAMERPKMFSGVVLVAPAIKASPEALSPLRYHLGRMAARICPQLQVIYLDSKAICRDPKAVEMYENDPLVWQGGLKAKWGLCMLDAMVHIEENAKTIDWPILILHGDADKICDLAGSQQLHDNISSIDKTLKVYEGYYHQLHSEPGEDGAGVIRDIETWISQRIK